MDLIRWKIRIALAALLEAKEEGQDLVEYALIIAVLALASIAGMEAVGNAINVIFVRLSEIVYIALQTFR